MICAFSVVLFALFFFLKGDFVCHSQREYRACRPILLHAFHNKDRMPLSPLALIGSAVQGYGLIR